MVSAFDMRTLEITIPVQAEWPTGNELSARDAVEDALNAAGLGLCTGRGGGLGQMHLTYRIDDESKLAAARSALDVAMRSHMPTFTYDVNVF